MFKRLLLILILAAISFFVYSKINPSGAEDLTNKIKQTYNKILGKEELTGAALTGDLLTGEFLSGGLENLSGEINTGAEISGGDLGIGGMIGSGAADLGQTNEIQNTGATTAVTPTTTTTTPIKTTSSTTTNTTTTTKTNNGGLSSRDIGDTKKIMNNLFK